MNTTTNSMATAKTNNMKQVVIDLRPQVKHQDGHGRDKVADVYFRTLVRAYSRQVCGDYSEAAHEAAKQALKAYYSEVVELLKGEDWTLLNENYEQWQSCPKMAKGAQYLYIHPDEICGEVTPEDVEPLEAKFKTLKACEYRWTDNYGDIILTRSEADERMLYRETYPEGIADTIRECTTTKRSNLYKDRGDALGCIRNRVAIQNKRTDLSGHGTGYYRERKAVAGFVQEEYDRLLQAGYIKEATGQNGRTLCRWINKKEEKELNKARREAEKAASDGREIRDFKTWNGVTVKGEDRKKRTPLQDTREITEQREQNDACISSAESRRDKANDQITEAEGIKVGDKVKHVWSDEVATVTAIRKAYWDASAGEVWLFTLDYGKDTRGEWKTVLGPFKMDLNGKEFRREAFTLYEPSEITEQREQNDACISSAESRRDKANAQIRAAAIVREQRDRPGHVNTSWATDYTPDDFEKLTSRYEIADEDRDIVGRRFHTGEGLWTVDVFVSDYAGNEAHALIYLLTGEGEVRANVLNIDHLRQTLTEAKGWTRTA